MRESKPLSALHIFITLLLACALGSAIGMALSFPVFYLEALLMAPAAFFMGPFYAIPVILMCFLLYLYLDRRGARAAHIYMGGSVFLGGVYGLFFCFFKTYGMGMMLPFVLGSLIAGWLYWLENYSAQTHFRIFK